MLKSNTFPDNWVSDSLIAFAKAFLGNGKAANANMAEAPSIKRRRPLSCKPLIDSKLFFVLLILPTPQGYSLGQIFPYCRLHLFAVFGMAETCFYIPCP